MVTEVCSAGFPHSEISGSSDICSSPLLIAAYHVFLRLSVPRHPPCALSCLTFLYIVASYRVVFWTGLHLMQFVLFKSSNLIMNYFWIFDILWCKQSAIAYLSKICFADFDNRCLVNYKWLFIIISLYEVLKVQLAKIHEVNFRPVSNLLLTCFLTIDLSTEWRWGDSNPWPPACKAGALPTELHPRNHHYPIAHMSQSEPRNARAPV